MHAGHVLHHEAALFLAAHRQPALQVEHGLVRAQRHDQVVALGCGALQELDVAAVQHIEAAADHDGAGHMQCVRLKRLHMENWPVRAGDGPRFRRSG